MMEGKIPLNYDKAHFDSNGIEMWIGKIEK